MNKDYSILIVDDSANTLFIISEMLRKAGYHVECAENGQTALDMRSSRHFDLFIIDVMMPKMNGIELLRQLNIFEKTYGAVMVSAAETVESVRESMELGAIGYIAKTALQDKLLNLVEKALQTVDMKKKRMDHFIDLEKKLVDKSSELESMVRLLEYQGRQMDSIINSMGEGLVAIDNERSIVLMNKSAEQMLGLRFTDCAGLNVKKALQSVKNIDLVLSFIETNSKLGIKNSIFKAPQGNGINKYYNINRQQISDDKGSETGFVVLFSDVSESINAEHMRDSFFSVAAHELRVPVSINMNYLTVLQNRKDGDDDYRENIDGMLTANRRLSVLINRIISFAKLSAFTYTINRNSNPIEPLIRSKLQELKYETDEKRISINLINQLVEETLPIDLYLLKIALYELLSNAIKFNRPEGTVRIELAKKSENLLSIAISDEGEGISDLAKSVLFMSFMQGEDPLTRTQGGMGIGLYLAKRATDLMGGTIEVISEKGMGATFTLKVPLQ